MALETLDNLGLHGAHVIAHVADPHGLEEPNQGLLIHVELLGYLVDPNLTHAPLLQNSTNWSAGAATAREDCPPTFPSSPGARGRTLRAGRGAHGHGAGTEFSAVLGRSASARRRGARRTGLIAFGDRFPSRVRGGFGRAGGAGPRRKLRGGRPRHGVGETNRVAERACKGRRREGDHA